MFHRCHPATRRRSGRIVVAGLTSVLLSGAVAMGGPAAPSSAVILYNTSPVGTFATPVAVVTRPQTGRTYVAQKNGLVYLLRPGDTPLLALDMRAYTRSAGERGLLGLAFHPTLDYVYVSHTTVAGSSRLAEYQVLADGTFKRASRRVVLTQSQPFANHNGGYIEFGPDGYLYFGFGDGGSGGDPRRYALKLNTWLGKIIRINPRPAGGRAYQVPADNPFVSTPGAKKEIWSIGLRNPWRFSFDSLNGDLWIGDVGQGVKEEINLARSGDGRGKGVSFGWSAYEGTNRYNLDQTASGHQAPLFEYGHNPECSVTGGVVYRGTAMPALQGAYLFGDFCSGKIWALTLSGDTPSVAQILTVAHPVSFGTDDDGEVYIASLDGPVVKVVPTV